MIMKYNFIVLLSWAKYDKKKDKVHQGGAVWRIVGKPREGSTNITGQLVQTGNWR